MCGFAGFIDYNLESSEYNLDKMLHSITNRGPDDTGKKLINEKKYQFYFGHNRLSILDLSAKGRQPYVYKNLSMAYNGEVYNFKEIRKELEALEYDFESDSDTEVIIKAYHAWGEESIQKFNGMFSIAIYDENLKVLKLIRDRAGVKPLYFYQKDNLILFASEVKVFHQHPNFNKELSNNSIAMYMKYGSIPQPNSIFKYVRKIKNGNILTFNLVSQEIKEVCYWDVYQYFSRNKLEFNEQEALKRLDCILNSAVNYRMISDVNIGSFLSGGYDSSLVTAIMKKNSSTRIKTFTIGFENAQYNEANYAREIAEYLDTDHTEYICSEKDAIEMLGELPSILDEPMSDTSIIPTLILSKMTKQNVTVSLSADGGDELFAGYSSYHRVVQLEKYLKYIPAKMLLSKLLSFFTNSTSLGRKISRVVSILKSKNIVELYDCFSDTFLDENIERLLLDKNVDCRKSSIKYQCDKKVINSLDLLLARDFQSTQVDQLLMKVDRASMRYSLEAREPLLDYRLVEFAAQLPIHMKINAGTGKYLLKSLAHEYLPTNLMDRPKMGFSVPLKDWFGGSFRNIVIKYLDEKRIDKQNIFVVNEVKKIKNDYLDGGSVNFKQLWSMVVFQVWYEKWIE